MAVSDASELTLDVLQAKYSTSGGVQGSVPHPSRKTQRNPWKKM